MWLKLLFSNTLTLAITIDTCTDYIKCIFHFRLLCAIYSMLKWLKLVSCCFHCANIDLADDTSTLKDKGTALNPIKPDTQSSGCQKSLLDKIALKEMVCKLLSGKKERCQSVSRYILAPGLQFLSLALFWATHGVSCSVTSVVVR